MMKTSSWPTPWLVVTVPSFEVVIQPTNQAITELAVNSPTLTRPTGTPMPREAPASPPTLMIQLPIEVRLKMIAPMPVKTIHHTIEIWIVTPETVKLLPVMSFRSLNPGAALTPVTRTLPVISWVTPVLRPWRMKNEPRVTMKLGRPVRETSSPLNSPIPAANASDTSRAGQMFQCSSVQSRPVTSEVEPIITPAERSNSPPIISRATGMADSPISEEGASQVETAPGSVNDLEPMAKNRKTRTMPAAAPKPGRPTTVRTTPLFARRTSLRCPRSACLTGLSSVSAESRLTSGLFAAFMGSPDSLLAQRHHLGGVRLGDKVRAGQHGGGGPDAVLGVLHRDDDRQVPLQVGLLVLGEGDLARLDIPENLCRQRPGADRDLAVDRSRGGLDERRDGRVEREHGVDGRVAGQLRLDLLLGPGKVSRAVDVHPGVLAREGALDAVAVVFQVDVPALLDDAQHVLGTEGVELLAHAHPGDAGVLADVAEGSGRGVDARAGVDREHRHPGGLGALDGRRERRRISQCGNQGRGLGCRGGVDHLSLLLHVTT